jgi:hypothetical protein
VGGADGVGDVVEQVAFGEGEPQGDLHGVRGQAAAAGPAGVGAGARGADLGGDLVGIVLTRRRISARPADVATARCTVPRDDPIGSDGMPDFDDSPPGPHGGHGFGVHHGPYGGRWPRCGSVAVVAGPVDRVGRSGLPDASPRIRPAGRGGVRLAADAAERAWAAAMDAADRIRAARFAPGERAARPDTLAARHGGVDAARGRTPRRYRRAPARLSELRRRTGWTLPRPATHALEYRARGVLTAAH